MTRVPFAARVAAGVVVTVVEEARKLPGTAVTFPMTVVSEILAGSMRLQQQVTALAIKGDEAISSLPLVGTPAQEQPSWAVFDDDHATPPSLNDDEELDVPDHEPVAATGRFALYSTPPADVEEEVQAETSTARPEIVDLVDYDALALAQLRARLRTLSLDDLETLLDYEADSRARPPFLTMLENRITTAKAK
ncbi:lipid droplet-associated protein [Rhodococcus sp. H29-C3]|uniref:lipid droplet-associated protein n=1 Tax=Rhodococcus sp. H29-C3 TaxID=3046307 RepID=UPI0024B9F507|nr:lipid droplet-associated protein [Rhodococcus sp. H29-C3]MDJ0358778.1 lipid droplet-associated protein [Rhodococcus sp. H29-C3]